MREWDEIYPEYGFEKHKGYGTKMHIDAIKEYGLCPLHRLSFVKNIISIFKSIFSQKFHIFITFIIKIKH